jgi:hypothetical protein
MLMLHNYGKFFFAKFKEFGECKSLRLLEPFIMPFERIGFFPIFSLVFPILLGNSLR